VERRLWPGSRPPVPRVARAARKDWLAPCATTGTDDATAASMRRVHHYIRFLFALRQYSLQLHLYIRMAAPTASISRTPRADLYALGCVAYYLLTGEQVFTGDTVLKVITQHLQAVPVPPSERTERQKSDLRTRGNWRSHSTRVMGSRGARRTRIEGGATITHRRRRRPTRLRSEQTSSRRHRPQERAGRVTDVVVTIVVIDAPP
jgi:serine/threonine protein kinase